VTAQPERPLLDLVADLERLLLPSPDYELDPKGDLLELRTGRRLRGDAIPDALARRDVALGKRAAQASVDTVPAASRFTVEIDRETGRVVVRPSFTGEAATFTFEELDHVPWDRRYFRRGDRFQRIDREGVATLRKETREMGGSDDGRALLFPASLVADVTRKLTLLGEVDESALAKRLRELVLSANVIERVPVPAALSASHTLREYQRHGLDWLDFLAANGLGGVLADDMGLGKTLQTLSVVARRIEVEGRRPSLVVCPASLLSNWRKDAAKFYPSLRVALVKGSRRRALYDQRLLDGEVDLLVASYETARADVDELRALSFRFLVFDEAQRFKSPSSKLWKAVKQLSGDCKLALSGTPVETRLRDLWAITAVALPGYLGSESQFERAYELTRDTAALAMRMKPFLLHRRKTTPEIAAELPPKIVMPSRECTMTRPQRALYDEYVEAAKPEIRKAVEAEEFKLTANVLATLTRLKQICGHPAVIGKESAGSGKFDEFLSLLGELLEDGENRVLVFSQYVSVVELLAAALAKRDVAPLTLTGSHDAATRDDAVEAFNDPLGPSRVLLLSLRAGGVGLNLQAANHVVHYDRWWNPAVERQAEDRAHRLGQRKTVVVHRFLTTGSIEERIEEILAEREDLIGEVLDEHESVRKTITREDLIAIFGLGTP